MRTRTRITAGTGPMPVSSPRGALLPGVLLAGALLVGAGQLLAADGVQSMTDEEVRHWAGRLVEQAAGLNDLPIAIQADVDAASGVHAPRQLGVIVVPQKGLQEGRELADRFKTESGAPIGYLFCYRIAPVVDGNQVDTGRLLRVEVGAQDGQKHPVFLLLLSVRQVAGDDYRLYAFGREKKKPLVDAKFSARQDALAQNAASVQVRIENPDPQTRRADLAVTVFGKYQAAFRAGQVE